jgi:HB1, ASXL, restriction endonuclease HTH domain
MMTPEDHLALAEAHEAAARVHRKYTPPLLRGAGVKDACLAVLDETTEALRPEAVYSRAAQLGYESNSKTPAKTFEAEMARSIQRGEGLFERPRPGLYRRRR